MAGVIEKVLFVNKADPGQQFSESQCLPQIIIQSDQRKFQIFSRFKQINFTIFFNGFLLPYTHSIFFFLGLFSSPFFYDDYNKISNFKITRKERKNSSLRINFTIKSIEYRKSKCKHGSDYYLGQTLSRLVSYFGFNGPLRQYFSL